MSLHVIVIGAVALGPKAACRFKRLMPEGRVTLIDQDSRISYGGCGIPYFVSGEVARVEELQSTPYGAVRDANFFRTTKEIDVLTKTRVIGVDPVAKTVRISDQETCATRDLGYDRLVFATGSKAKIPPIPGVDMVGISAAANLDDAERIKNAIAQGKVSNAVVVGGGFIGLEMAVAIGDMWGIPVSVVERLPHVMPGFLSNTLARMLEKDLRDKGVNVFTNESVLRFEGEHGVVQRVVTNNRTLDADLVIMAAGVAPNTSLATEAGIACTPQGLILVDEHMRTNVQDIYAGGDCVAITHSITGKPFWLPLGSQANRQGRVIGTNLAGGNATFPGAVGAWGVKLFGMSAAGAGLTLDAAQREGFDAVGIHMEQMDRAHFYPEHELLSLELVVERPTRRLLGIQGVAVNGDALVGRINAVVPLLAAKGTVSDLSNLEVVYSPPFASAMDAINTLGNVAENVLEGRCRQIQPDEFAAIWAKRNDKSVFFLDTRPTAGAAAYVHEYPDYWHNIPQELLRANVHLIPADTPILIVCNTGLRAYEGQRTLDACGITNTRMVAGGMSAVMRIGDGILPEK